MEENLRDLIIENKYNMARQVLNDMHPFDIATLLEEFEYEEAVIVFRILSKDKASEVFANLDTDSQKMIIEMITDVEIKKIIDNLFLDDTVDFIEEMPANVVKRVLVNSSKDKRELINRFLKYPKDSAGSLMTIEYVSLKKEMTIKEALAKLKREAIDKETINNCYVTNYQRKLEGVISIRSLILNDEDVIIKDIMDDDVISAHTNDDQEKIAQMFKQYDFTTMPIVDSENRLVGIITIDDIVDIIELENTEDLQKIAAINPYDDKYLKIKAFTLARKRFFWLLILMISATITQSIIESYEMILSQVIILSAFVPMLMGTGGNAGAQASTMIIRSLALGEVEFKDVLKVLWKELKVGAIIGLPLAIVNFIRIYFIGNTPLDVSLVVCASIVFILLLAKVVGGLLPILAKKIKLDPALMASPLITTILDACALIIYFSIAKQFIRL